MPATTPGLIRYLYKRVADKGHQPANPDENGIHVLTYHKSKGLEWPLVILSDLDNQISGTAFGVRAEGPAEGMDPLKPLAGRSIRFWPWPYGRQRDGVPLVTAAAKAGAVKKASVLETAEKLRLLYVGMTRARDYLILTASSTISRTQRVRWLDLVKDERDEKILYLPLNESCVLEDEIIHGKKSSLARIEYKPVSETGTAEHVNACGTVYGAEDERVASPEPLKAYYLRPSEATAEDLQNVQLPQVASFVIHNLGDRLVLGQTENMQVLGDCLHSFLAFDRADSEPDSRLIAAGRIRANWSVDQLSAEDMILASNRLALFAQETYPNAYWHREYPIAGRLQNRRIKGTIDLLLELPDGFVIIDHKSFPGAPEDWLDRVASHLPQLSIYKNLIETATDKQVLATYIYMAIGGVIIRAH
jgi:ATP-dependent exoDNAse (exonuclease V) beta subunit